MTKRDHIPTHSSPLRAYRIQRGMTQGQLGELFSPACDKATVSRWEANGVPLERVIEVEKVTGVPRQELAPDMFASMGAL